MNHRKILVLAALAAVVVAGCEQGRLRRLAQAADGFSLAVRAFQEAEIAAHQQGLISDVEHSEIERALLDVANAAIELDTAIRVAQSKPRVDAALDAALAALERLSSEGVLHVKNPQAQQDLRVLLLAARGFLATLAAALG